jgi:hypothetical protein
MDEEVALIRAFVIPPKRGRLVGFVQNPTRRHKLLDLLPHFRDLDPRFVVDIPPDQQGANAIFAALRERGAPPMCRIISTNAALDGREAQLADALTGVVGLGYGTLLSCVRGRLAYFEGEMPKDRCILMRDAG